MKTSAPGAPTQATPDVFSPTRATPLARELEVAIDAATHASKAVMDIYATDFEVFYKDAPPPNAAAKVAARFVGDDPVTRADFEASAIIEKSLRAAFPGDAVVSEESPVPAGFEKNRRCWFIDPVDGTKELVARNGEFCVMIGLAIEGRAALGVVAMPAMGGGFLVAGEVGFGATRRPLADPHRLSDEGHASRLSVTTTADPSHATIVASRSRRSPRLNAIFANLGSPKELNFGSIGVKISKLVTGEADAYLHPPSPRGGGSKRWDVCGPEAIVIAAGGAFTDATGARIDYASTDLVNRAGLVASNGLLHERLLFEIARVVKP